MASPSPNFSANQIKLRFIYNFRTHPTKIRAHFYLVLYLIFKLSTCLLLSTRDQMQRLCDITVEMKMAWNAFSIIVIDSLEHST